VDGIRAYPYNPTVDKLARLHETSPLFARGRVWTVESEKNPGQPRAWADPLIAQACTFRGEGTVAHDDLMDTMTQALITATHFKLISAVSETEFIRDEQDRFEKQVAGESEDEEEFSRNMVRHALASRHAPNPYAS
jgi:hypothetical protein